MHLCELRGGQDLRREKQLTSWCYVKIFPLLYCGLEYINVFKICEHLHDVPVTVSMKKEK